MNKIVTLLISTLLIAASYSAQAQSKKEYKQKLVSGSLILNEVSDLIIKGTDGQEVIMESYVEDADNNARSRGLKPLNSAGLDDNTGLGFAADLEGDKLTVTQLGKDCNCEALTVYVPRNVDIVVSGTSMHSDGIKVSDISSELNISALHQNVVLENVTGPMSIKTVYGQIEGSLGDVNQNGSISLHAVYGLVDIAIPTNTKAKLEVQAPYGEIYSNLDIDFDSNGELKTLTGKKIKGSLNGGGVPMFLKATYDNVYLRAK